MSKTILRILADPSRAVFWRLEMLRLQWTASRCLRKLMVIVPNAPITTGTIVTFRKFQFFLISLFRS